MPQLAYGLFIAAVGLVLSILEPRLDQLITPLDSNGLSIADLLRDLDTKEEDSVNWVLLPFVNGLPSMTEVISLKDFRRLKAGYNYNIAQIEVARSSAGDFVAAKRNFRRLVLLGLLAFVPTGLMVSAFPDEWLVPTVVSVFSLFAGLMIGAFYAYRLMRGARNRYNGATVGLRERLSRRAATTTDESSQLVESAGVKQDDK